jgi:hypothetical protein
VHARRAFQPPQARRRDRPFAPVVAVPGEASGPAPMPEIAPSVEPGQKATA